MIYELLLALYFAGSLLGLCFVFKKAGLAWWKALVPVYNMWMWMRVCNKTKIWYVLLFVPAINIFAILLLVTDTARCFRRYNFFEQTFGVIFPWIYLPIVGLGKSFVWHDAVSDPPKKVSEARDWLDAIVFALVAAVIIRGNIFEIYRIPSSSMEKSLLVGDFLYVSKLDYGPRVAMTPLSFPLVHNTLPLTNGRIESYSKLIQLPYHRYFAFSHVQRYDAVVFNYPDGDTMCTAQFSNRSYHDLVRRYGLQAVQDDHVYDEYGQRIDIGNIRVRPVDKRENFIKRCIGLPGEDLQIIDQEVYINNTPLPTLSGVQTTHAVMFNDIANPVRVLDQMGVSYEDIEQAQMTMRYAGVPYYLLPLTKQMAQKLESKYEVLGVQPMVRQADSTDSITLFPYDARYCWSVDNYGPVHIPAAGEVIPLTDATLPFYRRVIEAYEGNTLEVRDGVIYLNGQPATEYTVKQNYYWMMGDNRHNSVDSRYWGFVPEDHIVGKAKTVFFSWDADHKKVRFNRLFTKVRRD